MPIRPGRAFETTRWSLILAAGEHSQPALAELCEIYWQPVFAFLQARCRDSERARDLTQSFFARLLEKDTVARAEPERGRFRSFLLKSADNFFLNEQSRERSLKRGGGVAHRDLDDPDVRLQPADLKTPEILFTQEWAVTLLQRALERLKSELSPQQQLRFDRMKGFLTGGSSSPGYARLARELGISETAVKVTAHRFRRSFGRHLRAEVAETVQKPDLVEDEIRFLLRAFAGVG